MGSLYATNVLDPFSISTQYQLVSVRHMHKRRAMAYTLLV